MVERHSLRRVLVAALTGASLLVVAPASAATPSEAQEVPLWVCDYDWQEGSWHIKQLIRCAANRWDTPGGPVKAIEVARCESGLRPTEYNPNGYAGLFQHATRYWPGRADAYGMPDRSVFNGRANIIVSVRMARSLGSWSAWVGCG
ncbi:MAG TPA: hypothetical protein VJ774_02190 [Actinomycetota bacterium]|nr:hypothetical protein [Actinomycetota bacterium]